MNPFRRTALPATAALGLFLPFGIVAASDPELPPRPQVELPATPVADATVAAGATPANESTLAGNTSAVGARAIGSSRATPAELREMLEQDPAALVRLGKGRYEREVRNYRCLFLKQELIDDELTPVQEIEVRYREKPHSVFMIWKKNASNARRALYIDHPSFVENGERVAKVEPAGAVLRLFVSDVTVPIHGDKARASSRRTIDEFGFRSTIGLFERYAAMAAKLGVLDLRSGGTGVIDGRPTFVVIRRLPHFGGPEDFPDALTVMHLDQEWLLPVAVYSYADAAGKRLLGSYVITQVRFNSLSDDAFKF